MNQRHRKYCVDVSVRRGAFCNTDHNLVCTKLLFGRKCYHGVSEKRSHRVKHYDVGKLSCQNSTAINYMEAVLDQFDKSWVDDGTLDEKWQVLQNALTPAAKGLLGISPRNQPDWFADTLGHLLPMLILCNEAYSKWVGTGAPTNLIKFRKARGEARQAITAAKNK